MLLAAANAGELTAFFTERAKYIPLRLELRERRYLRLLEGMLQVSAYTDHVDSRTVSKNPAKRQQAMRRELHSILYIGMQRPISHAISHAAPCRPPARTRTYP